MLTLILLIIALVCFLGAALSAPTGRLNLTGLGLAFLTGALIVPLV